MLTIVTEQPPLTLNEDGVIRIGRTRVLLDTVIAAFNEGATAEEIAQQYSALTLAEVYATVAYYLNHKTDVDIYLRTGEQLAQQVQTENEARFSPMGIRARLLARRSR